MSKQQVGPVKLSGLVDLYQTGSRGGIVDDTLLWSERMAGWTKLKVCVCPFCSSVASPLSPVLACTGRQDFPELQGHLQGEGRSRQVVETQGESSTTQALMTKPPAKAPGSSGVRGFLLGWLPKLRPRESGSHCDRSRGSDCRETAVFPLCAARVAVQISTNCTDAHQTHKIG